jgi:hypothetical protein
MMRVSSKQKDDVGIASGYDVRLPPEDDMMYEFP